MMRLRIRTSVNKGLIGVRESTLSSGIILLDRCKARLLFKLATANRKLDLATEMSRLLMPLKKRFRPYEYVAKSERR